MLPQGKHMKQYYKILNISANVVAKEFSESTLFQEVNDHYRQLVEKYPNREFQIIEVVEKEINTG